MLHDRVVAAEERICALTAELDRRAPALPPSPEKVTVQHATRGCFFSFLAAPGTWPAYEEEGAQEAVAKRLVAALVKKYDGARGHTSVTFCQASLAEAGAQHIGTAVAFMNAARAVMGRQGEGGELSEAAILAACPKATVVEGVVSSAAPGFTVAWAAAALDEAFGELFMHPDSATRRDEQGREDSVGQAVWGLVAGHRPSLEEVALPDVWEKIVQAARPWYLAAMSTSRGADVETYVEEAVVLGKGDVGRLAMATVLNENVNPRVPQVLAALEEMRLA